MRIMLTTPTVTPQGTHSAGELLPSHPSVSHIPKGNCVIYFIGAGDFVKIGKSTVAGLDKRLSAVQIGCPFEAFLLAALACDQIYEKWIHSRLQVFWFRGEWFHRSPEIDALIVEINALNSRDDAANWKKLFDLIPEPPPIPRKKRRLGRAPGKAFSYLQ